MLTTRTAGRDIQGRKYDWIVSDTCIAFTLTKMEGAILYAPTSPRQKKKRLRPGDSHLAATALDGDEAVLSDDDDASVAAVHAMKRLKVQDDDIAEEEIEEIDDEKSSITSVSSADSTPPHPPPPRPPTEYLPLDDYPPTPKHNNRSNNRRLRLRLPTEMQLPMQPQPVMNACLGRLHQERRRQRPANLLHGMDTLSIETDIGHDEHAAASPVSSDLFLPGLSSSPKSSPGRRWRVSLRTDSKLE